MDQPTTELTRRLDRLERENLRLKRMGSVVVIGLAALVLMGQAMPEQGTWVANGFLSGNGWRDLAHASQRG